MPSGIVVDSSRCAAQTLAQDAVGRKSAFRLCDSGRLDPAARSFADSMSLISLVDIFFGSIASQKGHNGTSGSVRSAKPTYCGEAERRDAP